MNDILENVLEEMINYERDNKKVILIQFIKSEKQSGEVSLKKILKKLIIKNFGVGFVINNEKNIINNKKLAKKGINFTKKTIQSRNYDVITLDEIFVALNLKLVNLIDILEIIKIFKKNSKNKCLILTGRNCPEILYKYADLVTEMKEIKHPFQKGIQAIKGIDY